MFKKALIASAVLAATSTLAFANGGGFVPAPPHHACNFYIGADISRDVGHFETDDTHTFFNPTFGAANPFLTIDKDFDWGSEGIDGDGFIGTGVTIQDRYYLGLEGFGGATSNKGDFDKTVTFFGERFASDADIKQKWFAGVSFIPGVKVTDSTMLYARVGWIISEFELEGNIDGFDSFTFGPNTFHHDEDTQNGIQAGLGLAAMVTQNVGIRGEWDWSRYQNIHETSIGTSDFGDRVVNRTKIKPIVDQFKFGLFYNFNMA